MKHPRELVDITPIYDAAKAYDEKLRGLLADAQPSQDHVYHYTSLATLPNIVESSTIHCTDHAFLNDAGEVTLGLSAIDGLVAKFGKTVGMSDDMTNMVRQQIALLQNGRHHLSIYCASWSLMPNDLSQWRAYAPKDGVSIGFRKKELEQAAARGGFVFGPVVYIGSPEYEPWMVEQLRELKIGLEQTASMRSELEVRVATDLERLMFITQESNNLDRFLTSVSGLVKSPEFGLEREWRCVRADIDNAPPKRLPIKYRLRPPGCVPYVELSFPTSAIDEIVIGPNSHPENAGLVQRLLMRRATGDFSIRQPSHSFRL